MTKEEAQIYLPVDDENDAHELYQEKLFELKQFFLNRFPMTKLIQARLVKFEKVEAAFIALGGEVRDVSLVDLKEYPEFDSIGSLFSWYNVEKNKLKLQIASANSLREVEYRLNQFIALTRFYASFWKIALNESDESTLKMGIEPNPMDLQDAINALSDQPKLDAAYIFSLPDDNCLKSEAKRLSLWLNFEMNE